MQAASEPETEERAGAVGDQAAAGNLRAFGVAAADFDRRPEAAGDARLGLEPDDDP